MTDEEYKKVGHEIVTCPVGWPKTPPASFIITGKEADGIRKLFDEFADEFTDLPIADLMRKKPEED